MADVRSVGTGGWWLTDESTDMQSVGTFGWWLTSDVPDWVGDITYTLRAPSALTWTDREDDADLIDGAVPDDNDSGLPASRMGEPVTDYTDRSNPSTTWTDR